MTQPDISVVISTYNAPLALELVLTGYFLQRFSGSFELVIADDGSSQETAELIEKLDAQSEIPIRHIWQPDEGFQKCRILNKAIAQAHGRLLLLTDGDCIPQPNMLQVHADRSSPGKFLTGGYLKLPPQVSKLVTKSSIEKGAIFRPLWLTQNGFVLSPKLLKLMIPRPLDRLANRLTPTKRTWNGHNASCYRSDAIAVNGFNEKMQYGGEDVEFGLRLNYSGIRGEHIRFSTIPVHLFHHHNYVTAEMLAHSAKMLNLTKSQKYKSASLGINQWL